MAFPYMYVMHFDHIPLRVYEGMYRIQQVQVQGGRNSWCKNGSRKSEVRKKENSKSVWGSLVWGRSLGTQAQVGWVRSHCSDWLIKRTIVLFQNSTRLTRTSPFCLCPQTIDLSSLTTNLLVSWLIASLAVLRLSLGMGLTLSSRSLSLRLHCLPLPYFFFVLLIFHTVLCKHLGFPSSPCVPATLTTSYPSPSLVLSPRPELIHNSVRATNLSPSLPHQYLTCVDPSWNWKQLCFSSAQCLCYAINPTYSLWQQSVLWGY